MFDELVRIEKLGYNWSVANKDGIYLCRIWKDVVVNRQMTRPVYVGTFGKYIEDAINECIGKFNDKLK
jgi:hypothetical protein